MMIAVTGAAGFIGSALIRDLHARGFAVRAISRRPPADDWGRCARQEHVVIGDIGADTDWTESLRDATVVIHLAAMAHQMRNRTVNDPPPDVDAVNVAGSKALARAAVSAGVQRLVFVSTIGVHGTSTAAGRRLVEESPVRPADAYAASKLQAEQAIEDALRGTGTGAVIVRPPLVYGAKAPGNFGRLVSVVHKGWPLPLAGLENRRSFVSLANLVDFLACVAVDERALGETFLVSDQEDLSTPEFLNHLAAALHVRLKLIYVPQPLLRVIFAAAGRQRDWARLACSLQVDSGKATRLLGWHPPFGVAAGLQQSVGAIGEAR